MTAARNISLATITADQFEALAPSTRKSFICRLTGTLLTNDYARVTGRELTVGDCNRLLAIAESAQDNSKSEDVQVWAEQICNHLHKQFGVLAPTTAAPVEAKPELIAITIPAQDADAAARATRAQEIEDTELVEQMHNHPMVDRLVGRLHEGLFEVCAEVLRQDEEGKTDEEIDAQFERIEQFMQKVLAKIGKGFAGA
jgi:hypothetical protein